MNTEYTRKVLEAGLMAAGRTLSLGELAQLFDEVDRPDNEQLRGALAELGESWAERAIELKETAAGFRVQVRQAFADQVSRLWPERPPRYSRALLETLSIVAYRQPITRGEIESVRGVAVNPNIVRTLFERNWIRVVGHREVPGRPELLGTTRDFLDYFGLKTLDQLPSLAEIKSLEELDPQLALPEPVGVALPAPENMGESADGEVNDDAAGQGAQADGDTGGADARPGEVIEAEGEGAVEGGGEAEPGVAGDAAPGVGDDAAPGVGDDAAPCDTARDDGAPDDAAPDDAQPDDAAPDDAQPDPSRETAAG